MSRCFTIGLVLLVAGACATVRLRATDDMPFVPAGLAWAARDDQPDDQEEIVLVEPFRSSPPFSEDVSPSSAEEPWTWQLLPEGLIYRPYLADLKASRFATQLVHEANEGWLWDSWLGTQVGLLRLGSTGADWPVGFQIDAEGSGQVRLDPEENRDVRSVDFRAGLPITFGAGRSRTKFGYYHLSSHLGDEFLLDNPGYNRLNYSRDVLILGHSIYFTPRTRVYGEAGWAFYNDVSKPWEFQLGLDHAPSVPTTLHGSPFLAVNGHLWEEQDYGGSLTLQTGWAWRGMSGRMLRTGFVFYNGSSPQLSFYRLHEQQVGVGLWYDP